MLYSKRYLYPRGGQVQFVEQDTGNVHNNSNTSLVYNGNVVFSLNQEIYTPGISISADTKQFTFDTSWIGRSITFVDEDNDYKDKTFIISGVDQEIIIQLKGAFLSAVLKWCDGKPSTNQDLDSHLVVFDGETKVAYANWGNGHVNTELPVGNNAYIKLDTDDLPGGSYKHADVDYAVETSSLYVRSGTWDNSTYTTKFYICFYNGSGTISSMGARVELIFDDGTTQTIYPPTVQNGEIWWHVFTYDATGMHITNTLSSTTPTGVNRSGGA